MAILSHKHNHTASITHISNEVLNVKCIKVPEFGKRKSFPDLMNALVRFSLSAIYANGFTTSMGMMTGTGFDLYNRRRRIMI